MRSIRPLRTSRPLLGGVLAFALVAPLSILATTSAAAQPSQTDFSAAAQTAPSESGWDVGTDVARDGTAVAASTFPGAPQWVASAVNDGDSTTRWASDYTHTDPGYPPSDHDPTNDWIQIELAKPSPVWSVVLNWQTARPASYELQTSSDGHTWKTVRQVSKPAAGRDEQVLSIVDPVSYVRMQASAAATAWGYSLWSFEVWSGPSAQWKYGTDVARDGVALAASTFPGAPQWVASAVNDGDPKTRWASDYPHTDAGYPPSTHDPVNDWIQIKLAEPSPVWSVVFTWQLARPASYEIQTSNDGQTWKTVRQVGNPAEGRDEQLLGVSDPVSFVRMQGLSKATAWGYSLWSFEVWSGPKAPPEPGGTIVPAPVSQTVLDKPGFTLGPDSRIVVSGNAVQPEGKLLAERLRPATGFDLPVVVGNADHDDIQLILDNAQAPGTTGLEKAEGYTLQVSSDGATIGAATAHGVFNGTQTFLQLLPPQIVSDVERPGPWQIDATKIVDYPRYEFRGLLIDPARNFIDVDGVKHIIDNLAAMKGTRLHMHLSDDQGWRVEIKSWPRLTEVGGKMSISGGKSGFYTQEQFKDIVAYADARFVEIIPEIEMPGHSGAARAAYPELGCGGNVFCTNSATVDRFLNDVIGEVSGMVNTKLFHIGGDESISGQQYINFIKKVEGFVMAHGDRMVGWTPIPMAGLDSSSIHQYWRDQSREMVPSWFTPNNQVILSPTSSAYLDYPYPGNNSVTTYDWDPSHVVDDYLGVTVQSFGLRDQDIIGIEGAAWGEKFTGGTPDVEYKVFPREAALLDLAWSPKVRTADPESFLQRLAVQGSRWQFAGTNFWADTVVDWTTAITGTVHRLTADDTTISAPVASIASPTVAIGALAATIDWGDGTTTAGLLSGSSASEKLGNSLYEISGAHAYKDAKARTGTVTVTGTNGATWTTEFVVQGEATTPTDPGTDTPTDTPTGTPMTTPPNPSGGSGSNSGTRSDAQGDDLAATGSDLSGLVLLFVALMGAGGAVLLLNRSRRTRRDKM